MLIYYKFQMLKSLFVHPRVPRVIPRAMATSSAQEQKEGRVVIQSFDKWVREIDVDRIKKESSTSYDIVTTPEKEGSFDADSYAEALTTQRLGRTLATASELSSTQDFLMKHASVLPDGIVCVADTQSKGRGRGGNHWTSPEGCLMFSIATRVALDGKNIPFVQAPPTPQYVFCLAATEAVARLTRERLDGEEAVILSIKWPNDLYYEGRKIGGILCQSSYRDGRFHLVAGMGLNLSNEAPTSCINTKMMDKARAKGLPLPDPISREELLAALVSEMEAFLTILEAQGFAPLEDLYLSRWLHSGQRVHVLDEDGQPAADVVIGGIAGSGFLVATDESGKRWELHPDGNSLDFFKGLIRKKMAPF